MTRTTKALVATVLLGIPAVAVGQSQECDERAGTLGIQGLRCEGCTYSMSESGIEEARFRTEPQVMAVVRGFTEGDRLRAGDYIVAIDGALVSTREGGNRLVDLRAAQELTVRVRRDGRVMDLEMVAGSACELRRQVREREVEVERVDGRRRTVREIPPPPARAPLPALPAMPAMPPFGYLGFGIECGNCGLRDGVRFFTSPPTVIEVAEDGPAERAGLEVGDVLLEVDGLDITGPAGGERFSEIESGQSFQLTVRRDGESRTVTMMAGARPGRPRVAAPAPAAAGVPVVSDRLRYEGQVGDVALEVRGSPVTVTVDESTGEVVILTRGNVIRIKPEG